MTGIQAHLRLHVDFNTTRMKLKSLIARYTSYISIQLANLRLYNKALPSTRVFAVAVKEAVGTLIEVNLSTVWGNQTWGIV